MSIHKVILFSAFLILLTSCASPRNSGVVQGGTPPTKVMTITPTPVPYTPTVGPIPDNCPVSHPIPHSISPSLAPVIGTTPVWATWPRDFNTLHISPPVSYISPYGWQMMKVVWEVGPDYTHTVTVRGYEHSDRTPLFFQFLDNTPVANAVLDSQHPDHPSSAIGEGWAEWGSYLVIPKAGCYTMEVSWATGHWTVTFAAGV